MAAICQRNPETLKEIGEKFGVEKRFTSYDELVQDPDIDAVHINTPIPDHAHGLCRHINRHATRIDQQ